MSLIEPADRRAKGLRPRTAKHEHAGAFLARIDWLLFSAVVALVLYGLWAIGGITRHDPGGSAAPRQAAYAVVGFVLLAGALFLDPAIYPRFKLPIYGRAPAAVAPRPHPRRPRRPPAR